MTNDELTRERIEAALSVFKLHHKMLVNEIDGMTHAINESIDAFAVGIANEIDGMTHDILANAELERQSVNDRLIRQLIYDFETNNVVFKEGNNSSDMEDWERKLVIDALRAYKKGDNHDD